MDSYSTSQKLSDGLFAQSSAPDFRYIFIRVLSLPFNELTGEIPEEIWGMKKVEVIDLERNMLNGNLNSNFRDLESLRVLNLGFIQISGNIPNSLSNLMNLQFKPSDFQTQYEYNQWQRRNLKILELGLLLSPKYSLTRKILMLNNFPESLSIPRAGLEWPIPNIYAAITGRRSFILDARFTLKR
ncbi:hypothetical protein L2E82_50034 [Cichorium intybus]|nr:hypothetical protein L2E82_50034 [Cichorium intybus]